MSANLANAARLWPQISDAKTPERKKLLITEDMQQDSCPAQAAGPPSATIEQMFASLRMELKQDINEFQSKMGTKLGAVQTIIQAVVEPIEARQESMEGRLSACDHALDDMRRQVADIKDMQTGTETAVRWWKKRHRRHHHCHQQRGGTASQTAQWRRPLAMLSLRERRSARLSALAPLGPVSQCTWNTRALLHHGLDTRRRKVVEALRLMNMMDVACFHETHADSIVARGIASWSPWMCAVRVGIVRRRRWECDVLWESWWR